MLDVHFMEVVAGTGSCCDEGRKGRGWSWFEARFVTNLDEHVR